MLADGYLHGRFPWSTRVLDAHTSPRSAGEQAYRAVQGLAERARAGEAGFEPLVRSELAGALSAEALDRCFDLGGFLAGIDHTYQRLGLPLVAPDAARGAPAERPQLAVEAGIGGAP